MTTMELLQEFSCSTDQIITKRKRTKRPRPSSSTSSSGVCVFAVTNKGNGKGEVFNNNSISVSSPTASSTGLSTTTEENEEDFAANCLILLARGGLMEETKDTKKTKCSRKFTEMPTTTIGKVGIYVYECKTCNRAFSSFQALGGHRASHKKPKLTLDNDVESCKVTVTPQVPTKIRHQENKEAKVHECAICGSEFGSGQALGGHMRRHRSAIVTSTNTNNKMKFGVISTIDQVETISPDASENAGGSVLVLDLNLPAETEEVEEDHSAMVDYQY